MLQIRPQGGGMPYAPDRDLVNIYPYIAKQAAYALAETSWENWLGDFLTATGTTEEDMGVAAACLAKFINAVTTTEIDSVTACLEQSGFLDLPGAAQLALMMKIGQVTTATYWSMGRDAMAQGETPPRLDDYQKAVDAIQEKLKTPAVSNSCQPHCCH